MPTSPLTTKDLYNNNLAVPKLRNRRTISSANTGISRNSSAGVWAEDYYTLEFPEEGHLETKQWVIEVPTPPPAAAFASQYLIVDEESYPPTQPRAHQRTLTALLPFRTSTDGKDRNTKKETKQDTQESFMPTLTGDKAGTIKIADKSRGGLSSWFTGSSAPVPVGIPVSEQKDLTMSPYASPERGSLRRPTLPNIESSTNVTPTKATPSNSRFNFFSTTKKPQTAKLPSTFNDDELLTLDIHTALYPDGTPTDNDPFSPTTFKTLLANAEALLTRLQTEYQLRTFSLHSLTTSAVETQDVLEEANTRAECLRNQLEELSHRMSMKDERIAELETQLSAERLAREKSISLVREQSRRNRDSRSDLFIDTSTGEAIEDLGISTARKWRRSQLSATSTAGTEGDSDAESDSVFSRSLSPTGAVLSSSVSVAGTIESTPEIGQAVLGRVVQNPQAGTSTRPKIAPHRDSLFQKMLGSINSERREKDPYGGIGMGEEGCSNCRGKDASVAWDTVGLLRAENKGLKERVATLEDGVEGALGLCLVML